MSALRRHVTRGIAWLAPSVVAAGVASVIVGIAEAAPRAGSLPAVLASGGYLAMVAAPTALVIALSVRALWLAWQPARLRVAVLEATGGAPRLVAWLLYAAIASASIYLVCFQTVRQLSARTKATDVIAIGAALVVLAVALVLMAVSAPAVRFAASGVRRIDQAIHRSLGRTLLPPAAVVAAAFVVVIGIAWAGWRMHIAPRIGHIALDRLYVGLALALLVALMHPLWRMLRRRGVHRAAGAVAAASVIAAMLAAAYIRYQRPFSLLELWGSTKLTADAIELVHDIQTLRGELRLEEIAPAERRDAPRYDVVLITIDTMGAERTPVYGGPAAMPTLGSLGRAGTVFERALAPGNVTRRSLTSLVLGLHPNRVRGRVAGWSLRLDPRHITLAERFRAAGYQTAGFLCCETLFGPQRQLGLTRGIDYLVLEYDGHELAKRAARWLEARYRQQAKATREPLFMWLHFIEPHLWEAKYPAKEHGREPGPRYDMSLHEADAILATLMTVLRTDERKRDTLIFVTSDHGEALGHRGFPYHSTALYDSQIRVPLVVVGPEVPAQRLTAPVGLVDLAATMLDAVGLVPPAWPQMDSRSLWPVITGEVEREDAAGEAYSVMVADRSVPANRYALVRGSFKLIRDEEGEHVELYDLKRDPQEKKNIAAKKPTLLAALLRRLEVLRHVDRVPPF